MKLDAFKIFSHFSPYLSNYNRASDVCVCACACASVRACVRACVCKSTPKTADVIVTKIAGYVRVRIPMNR